MSKVDSKDDLPKDNYHIYHATSPRNLHNILLNGLKKTPSVGKWRRINKYLSLVREENSFSIGPKNRSESIFCFTEYEDVSNTDDENLIFSIDTREVNQTMYRANHNTVTKIYKIFSSKPAMTPEDVLKSRVLDSESKEAYNLAKKYWQNMVKTEPPIEKNGEILIDGDISVSAITHYSD